MNCSICNANDFISAEYRPKKWCNNCKALERHRYLATKLLEHSVLDANILEIAPYSKLIFGDWLKNRGANYISCDKWKDGNPVDKRDVSFIDIECDVIDLNKHFNKGEFDIVIMQHVVEEIENYIWAFEAISDVTKKGGIAYLEVPCTNSFDHEHRQIDHFGNLWKFSKRRLSKELLQLFNDVQADTFSIDNWSCTLFTCIK